MFRRTLIGLATAAVAVLVAAGCGGGSDAATDQAQTVTVEATDTGYAMPAEIAGGVVAMRFRNTGTQPHEFAMARVEDGHTAAEAAAAVRAGSGRSQSPSWLEDIGGPPLLTPAAGITITRTLESGIYVVFDAFPNARGAPGVARGLVETFTVRGNSGATLPTPDAVITAEKSRYAIPELAAGTRTVELRNAAGSGREFFLVTLNPGKTEADAGAWGQSIDETGRLPATPIPATFLGAIQTIPTGTSVFLTVELEAGREYDLSDNESGIRAQFTPS